MIARINAESLKAAALIGTAISERSTPDAPVQSRDDGSMRRRLGWWYVCIGAGFVALAARAFLLGAPIWTIGLRVLIAVGFVLLGLNEWRREGPPRA